MEVQSSDAEVHLRMSREEAARLAVALGAAQESISRAEFFIRTGLAKENIRHVAQVLYDATTGAPQAYTVSVEAGVESVENPRRPRPPAAPS